MQPFGFDHTVTESVLRSRSEPWTSMVQLITVFGDTLTLALVVIGMFVLAWLAGRIDFAALLVAGSLSGYLVMVIMKAIFSRDRPPVDWRLIDVGQQSFPSGHAMMSMLIYGMAAIMLHRLYPQVRDHWPWLITAPILVLLIGLSRVYLGVHWLSDVIFGWLFGFIWLALCIAGHLQFARRRHAARAVRQAQAQTARTAARTAAGRRDR